RVYFFSSRRRHTRSKRDWSSDVCSSDLQKKQLESKLDELKQRVFNEEKIHKTEFSLEEVIKYYMTVKRTHLNIEDKQKILRIILQEVEVIDSHTITLSTF